MDGYTAVLLHLEGSNAGKPGFFVFDNEKEYWEFLDEKRGNIFRLLESPSLHDFLYFIDVFSYKPPLKSISSFY